MTKFRYNRWLLACMALGLIAALYAGWQRHQTETANHTVEMVYDREELAELARIEGRSEQDVLAQFREAGVTSLAVYERTLEKMNQNGQVTSMPGAHLLHQYRTGTLSDPFWRRLVENGRIAAEDIYVIGHDEAVFSEVKADLERRLGESRVLSVAEGQRVLQVKADYEKAVKWNLGLPTDEMRQVAQAGFLVVVRPSNYTLVKAEDVEAAFARIDAAGVQKQVSTLMFVGEEALGYPNQLALTAQKMKERQLTLGMIEHPLQLQFVKQDGLLDLAALVNYRAARVYTIAKDEMLKLKPDEAAHRWPVTDQERNIRINLLRKFVKTDPGKTLLETNLDYVRATRSGIMEKGFAIGRADVFAEYTPSPYVLALIMLGAAASGVLFLSLVRPFSPLLQYILLVITAAVLIVPVFKGGGLMARQVAALASAVIIPALSMTWQLDRWRWLSPKKGAPLTRILGDGAVSLTLLVLFSLVGGLYVAGLLGDVRFFLEMEIYRGVKVTFIAPLLLVSITYLARHNLFGPEPVLGVLPQLKRMLNYPIYVKTLLGVALLAVAAWIFVGRSGHTAGVPVPAIEIKLRAFLEKVMYARPREKEFLIGHPAFFLAMLAWYRQWPRLVHFVLVLGATIAQGSLVETFAHLRTPVLMSTVRAFDGLLVGIVFGVLAVVALQIAQYLTYLLERRTAGDE